jgi:hypothetical protein
VISNSEKGSATYHEVFIRTRKIMGSFTVSIFGSPKVSAEQEVQNEAEDEQKGARREQEGAVSGKLRRASCYKVLC